VKFKNRLTELRHQLVSGTLPQRQPQTALLLSYGINFVLGFILSNATVFTSAGPFGIGVTAQAGAGIGGLMCAFGASIGYLIAFGFDKGIKYVAAVVLVFTSSYVFQELRAYNKRWFMPLIASLFTLITGLLGALEIAVVSQTILVIVGETILAGGSAYFFRDALSFGRRETEAAEQRRGISFLILFSCMLIALSKAYLFSAISLGRIAALLLIMTCAYKGGTLAGVAAGTALGAAMDLGGGTAFFTMQYSLCALVSGFFSRHSKMWFVISYILTNAVTVIALWSNAGVDGVLYEVFAASVVFMLLPNRFLNYAGSFVRPMQMSASESGLRKYTAKQIGKMSEAFRELYETVDSQLGASVNDEDLSKVFDRASESVCVHCRSKNECWSKNYMDTLAVFNDLTTAISSRGAIFRRDFPGFFAEKCDHIDELVGAVNTELKTRMYRRQFANRLLENKTAAYSQYAEVSKILSNVSDELQNSYGPDVLAQRRIGRYMSNIDIDADISVFRDKNGRLRIIIESARLQKLMLEPGYLDRLSSIVGVRLCRAAADGDSEGRLNLIEAEPYSVSVGIASKKKNGESVSGDRGTYFKTEQGVLNIILSDGMGSGPDAAKESVVVVRILEHLLKAGVEPVVAMKILNSMMLLKNGDDWGFATVDLMCINLFTGEAGFYKYGAAPSYVRSGHMVKRVRCENLAAGLTIGDKSEPDVVRMRLRPGNLAIVASDGVLAESNDEWIRAILTTFEGKDTKALARETVQAALAQYGSIDDMTVLAVRIDNRE